MTEPKKYKSGYGKIDPALLVRNEPKLNTFQKAQMWDRIIEMVLAGTGRAEIIQYLKDTSPVELEDHNCIKLIRQAKDLLIEKTETDAAATYNLHVIIYEEIFKYFESLDHTTGMNKTLKAKEKLLGILKRPKMVINKKTNITIIKEVVYDVSRLTPAELAEMKALEKIITVPQKTLSDAKYPIERK